MIDMKKDLFENSNDDIRLLVDSLMTQMEIRSQRYIEHEKFICDYLDMNFFKKLLFGKKIIISHMKNIVEKYKF